MVIDRARQRILPVGRAMALALVAKEVFVLGIALATTSGEAQSGAWLTIRCSRRVA
jgi:hypothetical protein